MSSSSFGQFFRITTFGESHGGGVGVVIDGCPPRLALDVAEIQRDLDRRKPGQSRLTTPRQEEDRAEILSGVFEGFTIGTPIGILVRNKDARPQAYDHMKDLYRPSHADFTTEAKYGIRNWQGGGRASARETIGRVAAGAIARSCSARSRASRSSPGSPACTRWNRRSTPTASGSSRWRRTSRAAPTRTPRSR